jgi:enterobacterial common antigen flippase
LVQGKRRIKDLAKLNIYSSIYGVIIGIPFIWLYGIHAIVPMIIAIELMNLITSWWYARKIEVMELKLKIKEFIAISKGFINLGFAFMCAGFSTMLATYFIRIIIIKEINLTAVGYYQASLALSSIYIGVILDAMSKDYYPRLTAVSDDLTKVRKMINDQIQIGLLYAIPGLMVTMVLSSFIIRAFYSSEFSVSAGILRWQILGVFLRVIAWPLGYMILAKGMSKLYLLTEASLNLVHVLLVYLLIKARGIAGTGIAFFIFYIIYFIVLFILLKKRFNFSFTKDVSRKIVFLIGIVSILFLNIMYLKNTLSIMISGAFTIATSYYCLKQLLSILGMASIGEFQKYLFNKIIKKHTSNR